MLPIVAPNINKMIVENGQLASFPFPPNLAGQIPAETEKEIFRYMLDNYIWGQLTHRRAFEAEWNKLFNMAHAKWEKGELDTAPDDRLRSRMNEVRLNTNHPQNADIADSVIYEAIDRLTNINHFISFKEELPVQYVKPRHIVNAEETPVYHPADDMIKAANALLQWNSRQQQIYRKQWILARHHYTYGISFVNCEFSFQLAPAQYRTGKFELTNQMQVRNLGVTYEPISIRKIWIDHRLPMYAFNYQPCPFFYDIVPDFAVAANQYNQQLNPFGFSQIEKLNDLKASFLLSASELESLNASFVRHNFKTTLQDLQKLDSDLLLLWTFYPMLPFDPQTGEFNKRADGSPVPAKRFIVQTFGQSLAAGNQIMLRLQESFYPDDEIPIFGSSFMPELDLGAYTFSIGNILENHYRQLTKALNQFLENKDWVNDPPTEVLVGSPAEEFDINRKGAKIPVNTVNDLRRREPFDASGTTIQFIEYTRESSRVASKAVEAILGKAMGGRTSATEASNVFQTAMSGITVDINLFNYDTIGTYASRFWRYWGLWVDPDITEAITGQYGFAIRPEHFQLNIGVESNAGSTFIESIVRQQNLRYLHESAMNNPAVNHPALLTALLKEWRFPNVKELINDGGFELEIRKATDQTIRTYRGEKILISPTQNHQIAIQVKQAFLEDKNSAFNTNPQTAQYVPQIIKQLEMHQKFLLLQMQQQLAAQNLQALQNAEQMPQSFSPSGRLSQQDD